jgi:hypothetical protein
MDCYYNYAGEIVQLNLPMVGTIYVFGGNFDIITLLIILLLYRRLWEAEH